MPAPKGNKLALGLTTTGQPPKFENPHEMREKIEEYFESFDGEIPTITGLCLFLGFASRQSFYDYEKHEEFSYIIKRARLVIENHYEESIHGQYSSGPIFALKNMGWTDRVEHEHTGPGGGPIETVDVSKMSRQERAKYIEKRIRAARTKN